MQPVVSQRKVEVETDLNSSKVIQNSDHGEECSGKESAEDHIIIESAQELFNAKPEQITMEGASKDILKKNAKGLLHCYSIVLLQEVDKYNRLIAVINTSLQQIIEAVQGIIIMSPELDEMKDCFLKNKVPNNWERVSYISLKSLASWFKDLYSRVEFMRSWLQQGHPKAYWLSGFFFPHGFMTGILQAYARKH